MRVHTIITCALAFAITASESTAQDTARARPKSDRRISVAKGEVELAARVDTVYVTRFDTVYVTRTNTKTIVRVDTVQVPVQVTVPVTQPAIVPVKGPLSAAVYAGMTTPSGNIDRLYTNGFHGGALLGWENGSGLIGLRLSGDITQIGREAGGAAALVGTKTPLLFTLGTGLKVMPLTFETWRLYGVGGVNYAFYRGIATASEPGTGLCNLDGKFGCYRPAKESDWSGKFGFNVGGGADFHVAGQEMFLEARATALQANGARTWFVPISFGLRFF